MKKNISILVLFGLLLAFGVLAASCDNGVLPNYTPDPNHKELEFEGSGPSTPSTPEATYEVDFYANGTGALGGDNTVDVDDDGEAITISQTVGDALEADGAIMKDPVTLANFKVTFVISSGVIKATKGVATLDAPTYP